MVLAGERSPYVWADRVGHLHCHEPVGKLQGYCPTQHKERTTISSSECGKTDLRMILETALDEGELLFSPHWDYFLCLQPLRDLGWVGWSFLSEWPDVPSAMTTIWRPPCPHRPMTSVSTTCGNDQSYPKGSSHTWLRWHTRLLYY